jgi:hypothetical protein
MIWYQILLELKSPLHVGYVSMGFVQKTRYYLPARSVWGALTAAYSRLNKQVMPDYKITGEQIEKNFKFTHFFICDRLDYHLPRYATQSVVHYGNLPQADFEKRFITSFAQTALDPWMLSADDESLHEKEVISHLTISQNDEEPRPVWLCGYVFVSRDEDAAILSNLENCQLGGDRKNGLGLVGTVETVPITEDGEAWGRESGIRLTEKGIKISPKAPFPCHVKLNDKTLEFKGEVEFLRLRSWDQEKGAGQNIAVHPSPCWVPGSFSEQQTVLKPGSNGIFKKGQ